MAFSTVSNGLPVTDVKDNLLAIFNDATQKTALGMTSNAIENIDHVAYGASCPLVSIMVESDNERGDGYPRVNIDYFRIKVHCFVYSTDIANLNDALSTFTDKVVKVLRYNYLCNGYLEDMFITEINNPLTQRWEEIGESEIILRGYKTLSEITENTAIWTYA